jgi:hypothetical protein
MTRIELPCKSRYCGHTACFDCSTFLKLNEQTPTWMCPICSRSVGTEEDLFLDGYFNDILQNTNKAVESVIIHPDGTWTNKDIDIEHPDAKFLTTTQPTKPEQPPFERRISFGPPKAEIVSLDDDEEETGAPTPASLPPPTRVSSSSFRASPVVTTPSRKRGPPQVVDLTLSDDEDEEPPPRARNPPQPPAKRLRIDPPANLNRSSMDSSSSGGRSNPLMNGVSPSPSTMRENQIQSPPSSISPRNESGNVFRYNTQPNGTLEPSQLLRPQSDYPNYSAARIPLNNSVPVNPSISPPIPSRPQLPSPTLNRQFASNLTPVNPVRSIDRVVERDHSVSPVLPAFQPPIQRTNTNNLSNSFVSFDWDAFQNPVINDARTWNETQDDLENEELDLEMARLPSSMFDADNQQDSDDY